MRDRARSSHATQPREGTSLGRSADMECQPLLRAYTNVPNEGRAPLTASILAIDMLPTSLTPPGQPEVGYGSKAKRQCVSARGKKTVCNMCGKVTWSCCVADNPATPYPLMCTGTVVHKVQFRTHAEVGMLKDHACTPRSMLFKT